MGLLRFLAVAAIVYYVVRLFNRVRKKDRFEAYEAGRQANTKQEGADAKSSKKKKASDDDLGDYVEFEEVKD